MSRPTVPLDSYPDRELIEEEEEEEEEEEDNDYEYDNEYDYKEEEDEIETERVHMNCWEFLNENIIWILLILSPLLWWLQRN